MNPCPTRNINTYIFACSLAWVIFVVFPLLKSQFGPIEDHLLLSVLGPKQQLDVTKFLHNIWADYLFSLNNRMNRHTPVVYFLRNLELFLFQNSFSLWMMSRIILHASSIFLCFKILLCFFSIPLSFFIVGLILSIPVWNDLFSELLRAEIYAVPAFLLYIFGLSRLLTKPTERPNKYLACLFVGHFVAIGSKESFYAAGIFLPLLWFQRKKARVNSAWENIAFPIALSGNLVAAAITFWQLSRSGTDQYGNSVNFSSVLDVFLRSETIFCLSLIVLLLLKIGIKKQNPWPVPIFLFCLYEIVVYRGVPTLQMRYGFPFYLLLSALTLIVFYRDFMSRYERHSSALVFLGSLFLLAAGIRFHGNAFQKSQTRLLFWNTMNSVAETVKKAPRMPVLLELNDSMQTEYLDSITTNLRYRGVKNRIGFISHSSLIKPGPCFLIQINERAESLAPCTRVASISSEN